MILVSIILALSILIWFMPSIIAKSRNLKYRKIIFIINLISLAIGWSFIIWLVLIVWSLCSDIIE